MSSLAEAPPVRALAEPPAKLPGDVESAHRGHAHAVERVRSLEVQLESAFGDLHAARQELIARAGVNAITEFSAPVAEAWKKWLAAQEVDAMAFAPTSDDEYRREREDAALRMANAGSGA